MPRPKRSPEQMLFLEINHLLSTKNFIEASKKIKSNPDIINFKFSELTLVHNHVTGMDYKTVKYLLENFYPSVEVFDTKNRNLLHVLCATYNDKKPDPVPLMHYLIFNKKANIYALDSENQRPDEKINKEKYPEFYHAYSIAYYVRQAMDNGTPIQKSMFSDHTQGMLACANFEKGPVYAMSTLVGGIVGHDNSSLDLYVRYGLDVNLPSEFGIRLLSAAISALNVEAVSYLVKQPELELNYTDSYNIECLNETQKFNAQMMGMAVDPVEQQKQWVNLPNKFTPMSMLACASNDPKSASYMGHVNNPMENKLKILELLKSNQNFDINFQAKGLLHPEFYASYRPGSEPLIQKMRQYGLKPLATTNPGIKVPTSPKAPQPTTTGFSFGKLMGKFGLKLNNQENQNNQAAPPQQPPASNSNWNRFTTPN